MRYFYIIFVMALLVVGSISAQADITFHSDPVHQSLDPDAPSPMTGILDLAQEGDARAQYILGDLYTKGKGGLGKNIPEGKKWFEKSARQGYYESFIRLAAVSKRNKEFVAAYQWYSLAIQYTRFNKEYKPWRQHALAARKMMKKRIPLTKEHIRMATKRARAWTDETKRVQKETRKREKYAAKMKAKGETEAYVEN